MLPTLRQFSDSTARVVVGELSLRRDDVQAPEIHHRHSGRWQRRLRGSPSSIIISNKKKHKAVGERAAFEQNVGFTRNCSSKPRDLPSGQNFNADSLTSSTGIEIGGDKG